jgi:hypothetical protein
MTDSPFVRRMKELDAARQATTSLSEKARIGQQIADLIAANHRGEPIEIEAEFDPKMRQANDGE